jgi:hypothetical protein
MPRRGKLATSRNPHNQRPNSPGLRHQPLRDKPRAVITRQCIRGRAEVEMVGDGANCRIIRDDKDVSEAVGGVRPSVGMRARSGDRRTTSTTTAARTEPRPPRRLI